MIQQSQVLQLCVTTCQAKGNFYIIWKKSIFLCLLKKILREIIRKLINLENHFEMLRGWQYC